LGELAGGWRGGLVLREAIGDADREAFSGKGKSFALWALPVRAQGFGFGLLTAFVGFSP
jgi:hypothetical protein